MSITSFMGIIEPAGPFVTIHKGWQTEPLETQSGPVFSISDGLQQTDSLLFTRSKSQQAQSRVHQKNYEFVNLEMAGRIKEKKVRKMIKSHASKSSAGTKRKLTSLRKDVPSAPSDPPEDSTELQQVDLSENDCLDNASTHNHKSRGSEVIPSLVGHAITLCISDYAVKLQPREHWLLDRYLTPASRRTYPVGPGLSRRYSPMRSKEWVQYSLTDAAMLQALLYAAAVHLALLEGKTDSWDIMYHQHQTVSILNQRLSHSTSCIEDSTVGAISCLALGEATLGNRSQWDIHMRGLKQILRKRGGISAFKPMLQIKLQRSDVSGAIDYAAIPHLQIERSIHPAVWSNLPKHRLQTAKQGTRRILSACSISPGLIAVMTDLSYFTMALQSAKSDSSLSLDPASYSEDMYSIESGLLTPATTGFADSQECHIDKACRMGGLLYIKAILEEFPQSKMGSSILLQKLKEAFQGMPREAAITPLLLWLCIIGAALSEFTDRVYYIGILAELTQRVGITSFNDSKIAMSKVFPLQPVFGSTLEKLWENTMAAKGF